MMTLERRPVRRLPACVRPVPERRAAPLALLIILIFSPLAIPAEPIDLAKHLASIASLAEPSPMRSIPEGWFLMGTNRKTGGEDPYGLDIQFDNTEQPQRRIWLRTFEIDRDEVSLAEYLAWVHATGRRAPDELQRLITHVITVHSLPDYVLARWPALYVTWTEADRLCRDQGKRLPTEAEWEKAARGPRGYLFPWGGATPSAGRAVFGQYHVHEIPLVAAVNGGEEGQSPYGVRHMAGNIAEWVQDWYGFDYYPIMPDHDPPGPVSGRYKVIRGGSWKSHPQLLRSATRNGGLPEQRAATVGLRCAKGS